MRNFKITLIYFYLFNSVIFLKPIYSNFLYANNGNKLKITGQGIIQKFNLERKYLFKNNANNLSLQEKRNKTTKSNLNFIQFPKNKFSAKKITPENQFKSNLNSTFKNNLKETYSIYISPFGKPINRAPDQSLVSCKSKECFE